MAMDTAQLRAAAVTGRQEMIDFTRRLIATPSLPGEEGPVAGLVELEMRRLGYDDVWRDAAGNVIGVIRATAPTGPGRAPRIMFNTHMDHVDVGDPARWPYPPYAATIADGAIWGRGASDLKGPLACQVHAIAALKTPRPAAAQRLLRHRRGAGGSRRPGRQELVETVQTDCCSPRRADGEPHHARASRAGRASGRLLRTIRARQRPGARRKSALRARPLPGRVAAATMVRDPANPGLGPSTVAPTLLYTDQTSSNVTPAEVVQHLDWRNVPSEIP